MNTYPPPHHVDTETERLAKLIEILRLATLVVPDNNDAEVSFIPMLLDRDGDRLRLLGHLDASNPQAKLFDGRQVQAIFHGPQGYISPDDYRSAQLPTWNYVHVIAKGPVQELAGLDARRQLLVRMSETFGGSQQQFRLHESDERMNAMLNGIRAFSIEIESLVGRFKLSQDKTADDQAGALDALKQRAARRQQLVFDWVKQDYGL